MAEVMLTVDNFKAEVIDEQEQIVLVDFYADWCGPCKMLAPIIEEIAEEMAGRVKVCKVNVDEEMAIAQKYSISSIPTLLVFEKGQLKNASLGYKAKADILALL